LIAKLDSHYVKELELNFEKVGVGHFTSNSTTLILTEKKV